MSTTPVLDLEQAPPKPSRTWLPPLIGFIVGVVIVILPILEDLNKLPNWQWPAFNGLLLIPVLYVAIAVHEIGHLVAGRLVDMDIGGIAVGGFIVAKSGKNWVFRFDLRMCACGFFKPLVKEDHFRPSRYAWMVAGGPLASFLLAAFCAVFNFQYGRSPWDVIGSLFWVSLFLLAMSIAPLSSGWSKTDGALLWILLRRPEQADCWRVLLALQTEEANGVRPREWTAELVQKILILDSTAPGYQYCQLLAYYRRLDEGREAAALEHLENVLARSADMGKAWRHTIFLEAASASATLRKHSAQARCWRDRACRLRKPESLDVVEAGIAMCEGRYAEAVQHWEAARARVLRRRLDSGLVRFAQEKWAEYEVACRAFPT